MSSRTIKQILTGLAGTALVAGVAAILWSVLMPLEAIDFSSKVTNQPVPTTRAAQNQSLSPAEFERIWATSYRLPLGDALPDTSPKVTVPIVKPQDVIVINTGTPPISLIGTIGSSIALLKLANNTVEAIEVGETINGITLLAIKPYEVEIRLNGQTQTLTKPADSFLEK